MEGATHHKGKPKMAYEAVSTTDTADQLDQVHMPQEDRDLAKQQLRAIERTLDALWSLAGRPSAPRGPKGRRADLGRPVTA